MTKYRCGDRVLLWGEKATFKRLDPFGLAVVVFDDGEEVADTVDALQLLNRGGKTVQEEVADAVKLLEKVGEKEPRLLSMQAAQLVENSRGRLTRAEKIQVAAMMIYSAKLIEKREADS